MKFIQKNIPSVIGWLAYVALKTVLNAAFFQALYFVMQSFLDPAGIGVWGLALITSALSGFVGFLLSAKWVTLPLSKLNRGGEIMTVKSLLGEWILLGIVVFLVGRFPVIALAAFLSQSDLGDLIATIWIYFVSFLAYREIFSSSSPLFREFLKEKDDSSMMTTK